MRQAEIIIAKHRNGAVGSVLLKFRGEYARFQNPEEDEVATMDSAATGNNDRPGTDALAAAPSPVDSNPFPPEQAGFPPLPDSFPPAPNDAPPF